MVQGDEILNGFVVQVLREPAALLLLSYGHLVDIPSERLLGVLNAPCHHSHAVLQVPYLLHATYLHLNSCEISSGKLERLLLKLAKRQNDSPGGKPQPEQRDG